MTSAKHILVSTFFIMPLATKNAGGGPTLMIPSGELAGTELTAPNDDWSFASTSSLELKTRPADPYSVQLNYIVREGRLYIDAAEGKAWLEHMRLDPLVRVLFATQIYPLRTVLVGQPGKLEGSDPTRFIYRLDPC